MCILYLFWTRPNMEQNGNAKNYRRVTMTVLQFLYPLVSYVLIYFVPSVRFEIMQIYESLFNIWNCKLIYMKWTTRGQVILIISYCIFVLRKQELGKSNSKLPALPLLIPILVRSVRNWFQYYKPSCIRPILYIALIIGINFLSCSFIIIL